MIQSSRPLRWIRMLANALAVVLVCIAEDDALAQRDDKDLHLRMQSFLAAIDTLGPTGLAPFFPRAGDFTYRRTIYTASDTIHSEWRFPARDVERALDGPLWEPFEVQWEGQRVGLFADQARRRRGCWRLIANDRFVPPGAGVRSAIFVAWRLEDGVWVISMIADEEFTFEPLPAWAFPTATEGASYPELSPEPRPCTSGYAG